MYRIGQGQRERLCGVSICCLLAVQSLPGQTDGRLRVHGFSQPFRSIDVAAPEAGIVAAVNVVDGERVSKGQVLVTLDSSMLVISLATATKRIEAIGKIDSLNAELTFMSRKLEKLKKLRTSGAATSEELERTQTNVDIAQAHLKQAEETREIYKLDHEQIVARIERRNIKSPINGIVLKILREEAENVTLFDAHVVTVAQLDPLLVPCYVSPSQALRIKTNDPVTVTFMDTHLDAKGTIDFISPVVDPESATVKVKIRIQNTHGKHRSGERCNILFSLHEDTKK